MLTLAVTVVAHEDTFPSLLSQLPQAISNSLGLSKGSEAAFQYTLDNPRLTHAQRVFYEENGFLVIPNLVEHDKIDIWRCVMHIC